MVRCDATWQTDSRLAHAAVHEVLFAARVHPKFANVVVAVVVVVGMATKGFA
jgi:hypothetical protein